MLCRFSSTSLHLDMNEECSDALSALYKIGISIDHARLSNKRVARSKYGVSMLLRNVCTVVFKIAICDYF